MARFRLLLAVALCLSVFSLIRPSQPAVAAPSVFRIEGGGFGHGIGMSQYGALGFAQQGAGYQDILAHYFQGTSVQTLTQPGEVRIWLGADTSAPADMVFTPSGATDIVVNGSGVIGTAPANKTITMSASSGKFNFVVQDGPTFNQVGGDGNNVYLAYNGSPIRLDHTGHQYKYGQIEMSIPADNHLRAVLGNMSMEQYLYGLGEVPSSWPADALKAQVVAARTYALEKYNRLGFIRSECACTLWRDVRDQNYVGYEKETGSNGDKWVAAVNATLGQTSTYQGSPIQAFYSSSSGGHTENSENVFVQALPYLRGVNDPYDSANGQNSLHKWTRDISFADMQNYMNSSSSTSVGTLSNVEFVNPLGVSGRVIKYNSGTGGGGVRVTGSNGTKRLNGDSFRSVVNAASTPTKLPSSLMRLSGTGPYGNFPGGVFVAAGRLAGGDVDRVVVGADRTGGPHVRVLTPAGEGTGVEFMAYDPGFKGGVRVAVCKFGDTGPKIVTAPGPSGGPHIRLFNADGTAFGNGFFAYDP
ncbi:MAG: SpoIID/LytB domain-containing protein, partial [Acidimicrobiales bacterium]|nr:SpoIID/LytB domain-containing protein [Acidimicrobiales bacterium]